MGRLGSSPSHSSTAVSSLTTRVAAGRGASVTVPSAAVTEETTRGGMRTPPLASVWYTDAICSVVTETP